MRFSKACLSLSVLFFPREFKYWHQLSRAGTADYIFCFHRKPAMPSKPLPRSSMLDGSGVDVGVVGPVGVVVAVVGSNVAIVSTAPVEVVMVIVPVVNAVALVSICRILVPVQATPEGTLGEKLKSIVLPSELRLTLLGAVRATGLQKKPPSPFPLVPTSVLKPVNDVSEI